MRHHLLVKGMYPFLGTIGCQDVNYLITHSSYERNQCLLSPFVSDCPSFIHIDVEMWASR